MTDKLSRQEIEALLLVVSAEGPVTADAIGEACMIHRPRVQSRYSESGWRYTRPLVKAGLLRKLPGGFVPTEKGRIAAAMLLSKDPSLRAAYFDQS